MTGPDELRLSEDEYLRMVHERPNFPCAIVPIKDAMPTMTSDELRKAAEINPCPFCGSTNVSILSDEDEVYPGEYFLGECFDCHASGPRNDAKDVALSLWNARSGLAAQQVAEADRAYVPYKCDCVICQMLSKLFGPAAPTASERDAMNYNDAEDPSDAAQQVAEADRAGRLEKAVRAFFADYDADDTESANHIIVPIEDMRAALAGEKPA